jgi:hypothetical protein
VKNAAMQFEQDADKLQAVEVDENGNPMKEDSA